MNSIFSEKSSNELERLVQLGWQPVIPNEQNLRIAKGISATKVSFPVESYEGTKANNESEGFWANHRALLIASKIKEHKLDLIWEIGAGNGNVAIPLRTQLINSICVEPLENGAQSLAKEGFIVFADLIENLKLPAKSIGAFGLFDVLEHIEKPEEMLNHLHGKLQINGKLFITVPAHSWLFSDFDINLGHFRRYSKKSLIKLLNENNYRVESCRYFFSYLVIPALILRRVPYLFGRKRKLLKTHKSNNSQNTILNKIEPFLKSLSVIEMILKPPFGLSLICTASKEEFLGH